MKDEIGKYIKEKLKGGAYVSRQELKDRFQPTSDVDEVVETLIETKVIRSSRHGHNFVSGSRFPAFKSYSKLIKDINYGERNRHRTTQALAVIAIVLPIIIPVVMRYVRSESKREDTTQAVEKKGVQPDTLQKRK